MDGSDQIKLIFSGIGMLMSVYGLYLYSQAKKLDRALDEIDAEKTRREAEMIVLPAE